MSVPVPLSDVAGVVATAGQAFLVTVSEDGQAHVAGVACRAGDDDTLTVSCGRRSAANAAARPAVTLLFPAPRPDGFVLLIDATAVAQGDGPDATLALTPTSAVLHKPSR
jgi:hypothetical protein